MLLSIKNFLYLFVRFYNFPIDTSHCSLYPNCASINNTVMTQAMSSCRKEQYDPNKQP